MKISKEILVELTWGYETDGFKVTSVRQTGTSRWRSHHEMIVEKDGKYYQTSFSKGLTENQESYPFDDDPDEIECPQVYRHTRMVEEVYFTNEP